MKYYEVRCNDSNTKVCLLRHGFLHTLDGNILYEGDFPLLDSFKSIGKGLYVPEFINDTLTTKNTLIKNGFDLGNINDRLSWIIEDSDHRKDVRVINEELYLKILNNETDFKVVYDCNHLDSPDDWDSIETTYIIATKATHQLGDISSPEGDIAIVSQCDGENYIGQWSDSGMINVKFPINSSIIISKEEFLNIRKRGL